MIYVKKYLPKDWEESVMENTPNKECENFINWIQQRHFNFTGVYLRIPAAL